MKIHECKEIDNPFSDCRTFKVTFLILGEEFEHHFTFQKQNNQWNLHHIYPWVSNKNLDQMVPLVWKRVKILLLFP